MCAMHKRLILLTNDDGIESPGLWSAAEALSELGNVTVVAPREQCTGAGRSMPKSSDGVIREMYITVKAKRWKVYAVGGTPAQAVRHAILELLGQKPDLVVSGINYGENVGTCVTISGTIGAAIEGAAQGIPSIAVSLQTDEALNFSHSEEIDFTAAAHFTKLSARMFLCAAPLQDVDILKVEVPSNATIHTPWVLTRMSRQYYYVPVKSKRKSLSEPGPITYRIEYDEQKLEPEDDIYALQVMGHVSITPLSIDMTSRVDLSRLERRLHDESKK